jgi:hypothetical protein
MQGVGYNKIREVLFAGDPQHRLAKVSADQKRLRACMGEHSGEFPAARCQVKNSRWIPGLYDSGGAQAPEHVHP